MPEGPEVKRCSEVLSDVISGKSLTSIKLISGKISRGVNDLEKLQLPAKVLSVFTKGKVIFIRLAGDYSIISTLGMSGWWYPPLETINPLLMSQAYYSKVIDTINKAEQHTRLSLNMDDGTQVNYIDPRNFGNFFVVTQDEFQARVNLLGVDLLNNVSYIGLPNGIDWFSTCLSKKKYSKKPIAEVLLDQSLIAGIGNIYRSESLYLAGIDPNREAGSLSQDQCLKLIKAVDMVLELAYQGRGRMVYPINDVIDFLTIEMAQKLRGSMPGNTTAVNGHLVYGHAEDVMGNEVLRSPIGSRTAWWVPAVQT